MDDTIKQCPRCKQRAKLLALSRRDNKTYICSSCGTDEAMFDYKLRQSRKMIGAEAFKEELDTAEAIERAWLNKQ
jgi:transposase-like protein